MDTLGVFLVQRSSSLDPAEDRAALDVVEEICAGPDRPDLVVFPLSAHQRMESLEHAARIVLVARSLGQVNQLGADDVAALLARHNPGGDRR